MLEPQTPNFARIVKDGFIKQPLMKLFEAQLGRVEPGLVEIELPYKQSLTQQNGFLHAGVITAIVDNACGYAALSLMPESSDVLSIEFKVNLLSPAVGASFRALGQVKRAGRSITVCQGDVFARQDNGEKLVATMLATMMRIKTAPDTSRAFR